MLCPAPCRRDRQWRRNDPLKTVARTGFGYQLISAFFDPARLLSIVARAGLIFASLYKLLQSLPGLESMPSDAGRLGMGKNVVVAKPAMSSRTRSGRNRKQAARGRRAFARQHHVELVLERVQMQHVGGRIGDLGVGELGRAPIGQLLLLGEIDGRAPRAPGP